MSVVSLGLFANASSVPTVVLVDLQQEYLAAPRMLAIPDVDEALDNCRRLLGHCRQVGMPIAFTRFIGNSAFFNRATPFGSWIEGCEPQRNEMIFERSCPSCYSSEPFASLMSHSPGGFVLAGFSGEGACLSTLVDAYHRKHKAIFLHDASASHHLDEVHAVDVHRAVSKICGLYGEVYETNEWIASTVPRRVGHGAKSRG